MADLNLSVAFNPIDLQNAINSVINRQYNIRGINTSSIRRPLGSITAAASEFEKSMEAANARVLAFGATAGSIYVVKKAFDLLVSSTVDVERQMIEINSILGLTSKQLGEFSSDIFSAANSVSVSFADASKAALEFARQGLSVEETLRRTRDSLILARVAGMDFSDSAMAITAALNSFSNEVIKSTDLVDRLTNADANFAVSAGDLAEAIKRVGSSAADANVSLNETIALVTAAQQTTSRGGAVIGNSFKTIFTRLSRGSVLNDLEALGISTKNASGDTLPLIQVLKNLSSVYESLGSSQKSFVAELVGGVYQINILKATLGDLGKSGSVFNSVLRTVENSTGSAERRIDQLNQSLSARLNVTLNRTIELAAAIGNKTIAPVFKGVLGDVNNTLRTVSESVSGEDIGSKIADGMLGGIKGFLQGPGAAMIGFFATKLAGNFGGFVKDSLSSFGGVNSAAQQQALIQSQILGYLRSNPQVLETISSATGTVSQRATVLANAHYQTVTHLRQQNALMNAQNSISQQMAQRAYAGGARVVPARTTPITPAAGFIPNFNSQEAGQVAEDVGARQHGYSAGTAYRTTVHDGNGNAIPTFVNSREKVETFTNSEGHLATKVTPPNGFGKGTMYGARGFVPNFAEGGKGWGKFTTGLLKQAAFSAGEYLMPGFGEAANASGLVKVERDDVKNLATQLTKQPVIRKNRKAYNNSLLKDQQRRSPPSYSSMPALAAALAGGFVPNFASLADYFASKKRDPLLPVGNAFYNGAVKFGVTPEEIRLHKKDPNWRPGKNSPQLEPGYVPSRKGNEDVTKIPGIAGIKIGSYQESPGATQQIKDLGNSPESVIKKNAIRLAQEDQAAKQIFTKLQQQGHTDIRVQKTSGLKGEDIKGVNGPASNYPGVDLYVRSKNPKGEEHLVRSQVKHGGLENLEFKKVVKSFDAAKELPYDKRQRQGILPKNIKTVLHLEQEVIKKAEKDKTGRKKIAELMINNRVNLSRGFVPNFNPNSNANSIKGRNTFQTKWMMEKMKKDKMDESHPDFMKYFGKMAVEFGKPNKYPSNQLMFGLSGGFVPNLARLYHAGDLYGGGVDVNRTGGFHAAQKKDIYNIGGSLGHDKRRESDLYEITTGKIKRSEMMRYKDTGKNSPRDYIESALKQKIITKKEYSQYKKDTASNKSESDGQRLANELLKSKGIRGITYTNTIEGATRGKDGAARFAKSMVIIDESLIERMDKVGSFQNESKGNISKDLIPKGGLRKKDLATYSKRGLKRIGLDKYKDPKTNDYDDRKRALGLSGGFVPNFAPRKVPTPESLSSLGFSHLNSGREADVFRRGGLVVKRPKPLRPRSDGSEIDGPERQKKKAAISLRANEIFKTLGIPLTAARVREGTVGGEKVLLQRYSGKTLGALVDEMPKEYHLVAEKIEKFIKGKQRSFIDANGPDGIAKYRQLGGDTYMGIDAFKNNFTVQDEKAFKKAVVGRKPIPQIMRAGKMKAIDLGGHSKGFVPNFNAIDRSMKEERSHGKGAKLNYDPEIGPFVSQPGQGSTLAEVMRYHPEGLSAAISNSKKSQGLSGGFIPNFAEDDSSSGFLTLSSALMGSVAAMRQTAAISKQNTLSLQANSDALRASGNNQRIGNALTSLNTQEINRFLAGGPGSTDGLSKNAERALKVSNRTELQSLANTKAKQDSLSKTTDMSGSTIVASSMLSMVPAGIAGSMSDGPAKAGAESFGQAASFAGSALMAFPGHIGATIAAVTLVVGGLRGLYLANASLAQVAIASAKTMKEQQKNFESSAQQVIKAYQIYQDAIYNSAIPASQVAKLTQEVAVAMEKIPLSLRADFNSRMKLAASQEERASVFNEMNSGMIKNQEVTENLANSQQKGESVSQYFENAFTGRENRYNTSMMFGPNDQDKARQKMSVDKDVLSIVSSATSTQSGTKKYEALVDPSKPAKGLDEFKTQLAALLPPEAKSIIMGLNQEEARLYQLRMTQIEATRKQSEMISEVTKKAVENERARKKASQDEVNFLRERAGASKKLADSFSSMGISSANTVKSGKVDAQSKSFSSAANTEKKFVGAQTQAVIDARTNKVSSDASTMQNLMTQNSKSFEDALSRNEGSSKTEASKSGLSIKESKANLAVSEALGKVDTTTGSPQEILDRVKAEALRSPGGSNAKDISKRLEDPVLRSELAKNTAIAAASLKVNEAQEREQAKAGIIAARTEQNIKAFGGIENFLSKQKTKDDRKEFNKAVRSAGSGNADRSGRGSMQLILSAQKDLGGSLSEGSAGALKESAVSARARQIRQESTRRIASISRSKLPQDQKQALIGAYQEARGNSRQMARNQVEEAAKLERAPLEQVKRLDNIARSMDELNKSLTSSGIVIKSVGPDFFSKNEAMARGSAERDDQRAQKVTKDEGQRNSRYSSVFMEGENLLRGKDLNYSAKRAAIDEGSESPKEKAELQEKLLRETLLSKMAKKEILPGSEREIDQYARDTAQTMPGYKQSVNENANTANSEMSNFYQEINKNAGVWANLNKAMETFIVDLSTKFTLSNLATRLFAPPPEPPRQRPIIGPPQPIPPNNTGGYARGISIPTQRGGDDLLATLQRGEVVIPANKVKDLGPDFFANAGIPGFARGGSVSRPLSMAHRMGLSFNRGTAMKDAYGAIKKGVKGATVNPLRAFGQGIAGNKQGYARGQTPTSLNMANRAGLALRGNGISTTGAAYSSTMNAVRGATVNPLKAFGRGIAGNKQGYSGASTSTSLNMANRAGLALRSGSQGAYSATRNAVRATVNTSKAFGRGIAGNKQGYARGQTPTSLNMANRAGLALSSGAGGAYSAVRNAVRATVNTSKAFGRGIAGNNKGYGLTQTRTSLNMANRAGLSFNRGTAMKDAYGKVRNVVRGATVNPLKAFGQGIMGNNKGYGLTQTRTSLNLANRAGLSFNRGTAMKDAYGKVREVVRGATVNPLKAFGQGIMGNKKGYGLGANNNMSNRAGLALRSGGIAARDAFRATVSTSKAFGRGIAGNKQGYGLGARYNMANRAGLALRSGGIAARGAYRSTMNAVRGATVNPLKALTMGFSHGNKPITSGPGRTINPYTGPSQANLSRLHNVGSFVGRGASNVTAGYNQVRAGYDKVRFSNAGKVAGNALGKGVLAYSAYNTYNAYKNAQTNNTKENRDALMQSAGLTTLGLAGMLPGSLGGLARLAGGGATVLMSAPRIMNDAKEGNYAGAVSKFATTAAGFMGPLGMAASMGGTYLQNKIDQTDAMEADTEKEEEYNAEDKAKLKDYQKNQFAGTKGQKDAKGNDRTLLKEREDILREIKQRQGENVQETEDNASSNVFNPKNLYNFDTSQKVTKSYNTRDVERASTADKEIRKKRLEGGSPEQMRYIKESRIAKIKKADEERVKKLQIRAAEVSKEMSEHKKTTAATAANTAAGAAKPPEVTAQQAIAAVGKRQKMTPQLEESMKRNIRNGVYTAEDYAQFASTGRMDPEKQKAASAYIRQEGRIKSTENAEKLWRSQADAAYNEGDEEAGARLTAHADRNRDQKEKLQSELKSPGKPVDLSADNMPGKGREVRGESSAPPRDNANPPGSTQFTVNVDQGNKEPKTASINMDNQEFVDFQNKMLAQIIIYNSKFDQTNNDIRSINGKATVPVAAANATA